MKELFTFILELSAF